MNDDCRFALATRARTGAVWLGLSVALALSACQTPGGSAGADDTRRLAAMAYREPLPGDGALYAVDAAASQLLIYVFRGGSAAKLGHNHVISAPQLEGRVRLPGDDPKQAQFSLRARFDQLQIDDAALRERTGGAFSGARSADDIAGTGKNMRKSLEADRYPEIVINSLRVAGDWPIVVADVAISLHGVTQRQRLMLRVQREATDQMKIRGSLAIRQSDFGIKPYSVLGGVLVVQDEVAVEFELLARRAGG